VIRLPASLAVLAAALLADSAGASLPEMPPIYHYYGPVRLCSPGPSPFYAVDVLPGEAAQVQGYNLSIQQEGGGFGIGLTPGPEGSKSVGEAAELLGEIQIANAGTAQRIKVDGRIRYRINTSGNQHWGWTGIRSAEFDGSDRDRLTIDRIKFGPDAVAACAQVPESLLATPEKQNWMALWLSPRRHPGPFTLCLAYVAFDVRAGETAMLSWHDFAMARVDAGSRKIAITSGLHPLGSPHAWPGAAGALVDDPRFTAFPSTESTAGNMLLPAAPAIELRVMTRADLERWGPKGGGHVTFSFADDPGEPGRLAFARRLRSRVPGDRCYNAGRGA
jgi:hypothetical protein